MAYSQIKKGSTGSSVEELQRLLNQNGYSLAEDGVFGSETQAAVRDYQRKNGLAVDGIVGTNTWGSLLGGSGGTSSNPTTNSTANWLADYEGNKPVYKPSDKLGDIAAILEDFEKNKPGAYQSNYSAQIQGILDQIMNREKFTYDFNADPLYQQHAERYQQQGKLAMMDAMGQAAALTGGYGSSYGQQVGQQTYQGYLQGMNDIIPELRDAAYQVYRDEGDQMLTNIGLLQGLDESEYGRYRDEVSDYYNDLTYYYNKYNDMSDDEYNRYLNDLAAWQTDRDYWYRKYIDEQAQKNWEAEFDYTKTRDSGSDGGGNDSDSGEDSYSRTPIVGSAAKSIYNQIVFPSGGYLDVAEMANQIELGLNMGILTEEEADYLISLLGY